MGNTSSRPFTAPQTFPKFKGKVYFRDSQGNELKDYEAHAYQYATTSQPAGDCQPYAIVYVADDDDIKMALDYAKQNKLSLAVRSGGHHYTGASSTAGKNIQIDLSGVEAPKDKPYPYSVIEYDAAKRECRVGAGVSNVECGEKCAELGIFFPHGECCHVRLGGHVQTGGYGIIQRPFGLLADHIVSLEVILADGSKKTIRRDATDQDEKDLYFAFVGGSPGNYGVVTHATVRVHLDKDHPNARGIKLAYKYSKETLERLLNIVAEQVENPIPADYCYSVLVLGAQHFFSVFGSQDQQMRIHHSDLYGPNGELYPLATVAITCFWGNLGGAGQEYDPSIFKRIKDAAGTPLLASLIGFDDDKAIPVSKMLLDWTWKAAREFDLPFEKRLWMTKSTSLVKDGWAKWCAERVDAIEGPLTNGCKVAAQFMPLSGASAWRDGDKDRQTAVAWRDSTAFSALDVFYDKDFGFLGPDPAQTAANWCTENDLQGVGENGVFSKEDRRLIWAPFGPKNIDLMHKCYYDDEATYQRLLKIKRKVDPDDVFTPNLFCVGAERKFADAIIPEPVKIAIPLESDNAPVSKSDTHYASVVTSPPPAALRCIAAPLARGIVAALLLLVVLLLLLHQHRLQA